MLHARLEDFLRTGQLGPLCLPATRAAVRAALGPPDQWMPPEPVERSAIWRYGVVELHFATRDGPADDCWMIYADDIAELGSEPSAALTLDADIVAPGAREAIARRLDGAGVPYAHRTSRYGDRLLVTRPGVTLQFEDGLLAAIVLKDPDYR